MKQLSKNIIVIIQLYILNILLINCGGNDILTKNVTTGYSSYGNTYRANLSNKKECHEAEEFYKIKKKLRVLGGHKLENEYINILNQLTAPTDSTPEPLITLQQIKKIKKFIYNSLSTDIKNYVSYENFNICFQNNKIDKNKNLLKYYYLINNYNHRYSRELSSVLEHTYKKGYKKLNFSKNPDKNRLFTILKFDKIQKSLIEDNWYIYEFIYDKLYRSFKKKDKTYKSLKYYHHILNINNNIQINTTNDINKILNKLYLDDKELNEYHIPIFSDKKNIPQELKDKIIKKFDIIKGIVEEMVKYYNGPIDVYFKNLKNQIPYYMKEKISNNILEKVKKLIKNKDLDLKITEDEKQNIKNIIKDEIKNYTKDENDILEIFKNFESDSYKDLFSKINYITCNFIHNTCPKVKEKIEKNAINQLNTIKNNYYLSHEFSKILFNRKKNTTKFKSFYKDYISIQAIKVTYNLLMQLENIDISSSKMLNDMFGNEMKLYFEYNLQIFDMLDALIESKLEINKYDKDIIKDEKDSVLWEKINKKNLNKEFTKCLFNNSYVNIIEILEETKDEKEHDLVYIDKFLFKYYKKRIKNKFSKTIYKEIKNILNTRKFDDIQKIYEDLYGGIYKSIIYNELSKSIFIKNISKDVFMKMQECFSDVNLNLQPFLLFKNNIFYFIQNLINNYNVKNNLKKINPDIKYLLENKLDKIYINNFAKITTDKVKKELEEEVQNLLINIKKIIKEHCNDLKSKIEIKKDLEKEINIVMKSMFNNQNSIFLALKSYCNNVIENLYSQNELSKDIVNSYFLHICEVLKLKNVNYLPLSKILLEINKTFQNLKIQILQNDGYIDKKLYGYPAYDTENKITNLIHKDLEPYLSPTGLQNFFTFFLKKQCVSNQIIDSPFFGDLIKNDLNLFQNIISDIYLNQRPYEVFNNSKLRKRYAKSLKNCFKTKYKNHNIETIDLVIRIFSDFYASHNTFKISSKYYDPKLKNIDIHKLLYDNPKNTMLKFLPCSTIRLIVYLSNQYGLQYILKTNTLEYTKEKILTETEKYKFYQPNGIEEKPAYIHKLLYDIKIEKNINLQIKYANRDAKIFLNYLQLKSLGYTLDEIYYKEIDKKLPVLKRYIPKDSSKSSHSILLGYNDKKNDPFIKSIKFSTICPLLFKTLENYNTVITRIFTKEQLAKNINFNILTNTPTSISMHGSPNSVEILSYDPSNCGQYISFNADDFDLIKNETKNNELVSNKYFEKVLPIYLDSCLTGKLTKYIIQNGQILNKSEIESFASKLSSYVNEHYGCPAEVFAPQDSITNSSYSVWGYDPKNNKYQMGVNFQSNKPLISHLFVSKDNVSKVYSTNISPYSNVK